MVIQGIADVVLFPLPGIKERSEANLGFYKSHVKKSREVRSGEQGSQAMGPLLPIQEPAKEVATSCFT